MARKKKGFSYKSYKVIRSIVRFFYPKLKINNIEHLPSEPCVIVSNHCQLFGPIAYELFFPEEKSIWCASELCDRKKVKDFAYNDFFKYKSKKLKWWYKFLSFLMTPIFPYLFSNADTIPVYRDFLAVKTLRDSVKALEEGKNIIIFPESFEEYNNIVNRFNEGFVDIAKLYKKRTGKTLAFVPIYLAPKLKSAYMGEAIYFNAGNDIKEERKKISEYLTFTITKIAESLPRHKVVPHNNIQKKYYKYNVDNFSCVNSNNLVKEQEFTDENIVYDQ